MAWQKYTESFGGNPGTHRDQRDTFITSYHGMANKFSRHGLDAVYNPYHEKKHSVGRFEVSRHYLPIRTQSIDGIPYRSVFDK